jgi:Cu(I)/Ag(I) efflux system membrane fusion protein
MQNMLRSEWLQNILRDHRGKLLAAQVLIVFAAGYLVASRGQSDVPNGSTAAGEDAAHAVAGPALWTCSMHPQIRQPNPGKCPLCGMNLIPVSKTSGGMRTLSVSPESRALMSISSSPVMRDYVTNEIRMVGKVDYDETKLAYITAWVSGRLDRLYVDYTGVAVKKGDHMAYIYSEELYAIQEELIQAIKYSRDRGPDTSRFRSPIDLVESAREKLRLLGLTEIQIKEIEQRGKPSDHVTIFSPKGGVVVEKFKQEGERVGLGDRIYTIADLQQVWVHLDAYESDLVDRKSVV